MGALGCRRPAAPRVHRGARRRCARRTRRSGAVGSSTAGRCGARPERRSPTSCGAARTGRRCSPRTGTPASGARSACSSTGGASAVGTRGARRSSTGTSSCSSTPATRSSTSTSRRSSSRRSWDVVVDTAGQRADSDPIEPGSTIRLEAKSMLVLARARATRNPASTTRSRHPSPASCAAARSRRRAPKAELRN